MEDKIFIEKDFYIDPPELSAGIPEQEALKIWVAWLNDNAKACAAHKRKWTKSQKHGEMPNFDTSGTMVKINGIWKQNQFMTGLVGDSEMMTLEAVLVEKATQDKYFQPRGKRGGRSGNKHRRKRNNLNKKNNKRQMVLNKISR